MKSPFLACLGLLAAAVCSSASAAPLTVDNFSFESPYTSTYVGLETPPNYATVDNWTYYSETSGTGVQNIFANGFLSNGTADGSQDAWNNENPGSIGTITSTDSYTIEANTEYTLTVAVGMRADMGIPGEPAVGNSILNLLDTTTNTVIASTTVTGAELTAGTFGDFSAQLTAAQSNLHVGDSMTIQLVTSTPAGFTDGYVQGNFDNVRLDATVVPEPSADALLLGGVALLICIVRRRSTPQRPL